MALQCLAFLMLIVAALHEVNRRSSPQAVIEWVVMWVVWTIFWAVVINTRHFGLAYLKYPFPAAGLSTGVPFFIALHLCRRRLFAWIIMAFGILSIANTNYFGILPGLLLGAVRGDRKSRVLAVAVVAVTAVAVQYVGLEGVIRNTLFYGKEEIGWEHTSGRNQVWAMGLELGMKRPLMGYGFVAGERGVLYEERNANTISMHSAFFSAFLGVGFAGPLLLFLYYLGTWALCLPRHVPPSWRFAFTGSMFMVCVVSMGNPGIGGRVYGSWMVSVIVMTMITMLCGNSGIRVDGGIAAR